MDRTCLGTGPTADSCHLEHLELDNAFSAFQEKTFQPCILDLQRDPNL